ncbi:cell envelope integrity protein CreD [Ascidiimonas sp. W6]|uniref:cell envelope integrity protein CreD n=1 Tax=Ascidiimonas meishanensis TaxID=3128903 RepID=UPI0030EC8E0B
MTNSSKNNSWFKTSITARMLMVGFLILILMIPLLFIRSLINERAQRQKEVIKEINEKWGNELLLSGPILKVPYNHYTEVVKLDNQTKKTIKEKTSRVKYAYFFPDKLSVSTDVNAFKKEYGIYETAVFTSTMDFTGSFITPDFIGLDVNLKDVIWEKSTFIIQTSNLKGIRENVQIAIGKNTLSFVPRYKNLGTENNYSEKPILNELESTRIPIEALPVNTPIDFSFTLTINGSEQIEFIPIGKETSVSMKSNWQHPSFQGSFLPEKENDTAKNKDAKGFEAKWNIIQINRQFQQSFLGYLPNLSEFAFGVHLFLPVDQYQKSDRSAKYGYLVIALTFLIFFLIQTISKISIHPFQYLMIGLSLVMFYTLLISISEHQTFIKAYLIAGSAVVVLITLYSISVLKNYKFPVFIFFSLTALYAFIFVIISLENYALLVGSIGLFVILALVMFFSRKIDWQ